MVTLAQRVEALRTERGVSRAALSSALDFPKGAIEKFETGRQTPTKEQQERIASYFGVSLFYLRGESGDRTRQDDWIDAASAPTEPVPPPPPARRQEPPVPQEAMLDALLFSKQTQERLRALVLDTLRSPEGQALIAQAVRKAGR